METLEMLLERADVKQIGGNIENGTRKQLLAAAIVTHA
jgi:hypothetical protein